MRRAALIMLGLLLLLTGCSLPNMNGELTTPNTKPAEDAKTNSTIITNPDNRTDVEIITDLYRVYNADAQLLMSTNNIWTAIIKARSESKSSNKCYVKDKDGQTIYRYSSKYFYYRNGKYYGTTDDSTEAIRWAAKYDDSYVIDGKASEFLYVGKKVQTSSPTIQKDNVRGIENMSGSYGYIFSKKHSQTTTNIGYSYIEYKVEFSKAKLKYFTDTSNEHGWNAYIFTNIMCDNPWLNCDMGIMQLWESSKGRWQPVFNYGGKMYAPANDTITQMVYNEQTGYYEGCDDLFFRCYVEGNKYVLNITNLTTNVEYEYHCTCDALIDNAQKSYILLAASNCPVTKAGDFWNPYCGNAFENILFRDVKIAKYGDYTNKIDFYDDSEAFSYAIAMGAENASVEFKQDEIGKYIQVDMKNYQK